MTLGDFTGGREITVSTVIMPLFLRNGREAGFILHRCKRMSSRAPFQSQDFDFMGEMIALESFHELDL